MESKTLNMKFPLIKPMGYGDRESVAETLRDNGCGLIVLEETVHEEKRALMEYVSGAAFILGLTLQPVSRDVILAAPEGNMETEIPLFDQEVF